MEGSLLGFLEFMRGVWWGLCRREYLRGVVEFIGDGWVCGSWGEVFKLLVVIIIIVSGVLVLVLLLLLKG